MANVTVQIRNLTKKIGNKTIVDRLTFDVPKGEVFGLLGPNGAGKTTTIRMMVGLISITEGEVIIEGYNVAKQFERAIARVGAIVENPELYKFLSGYENLIHFARMIPGIPKQRIDEVVSLVKLENRIHDKVKTYSLGMRQRLGVAQAILHRPSVLILDEPTNGLDPEGIREMRDYLRHLARTEGTSVIVSSHLLSEMELMCDRVAVLQNGKLIDVRPIRDMARENETTVVFEVDRPEEARAVLSAAAPESNPSLGDGGVAVVTNRDRIPSLIRLLVEAQIGIYSVRAVTKSLEEHFLEVTRGGRIG